MTGPMPDLWAERRGELALLVGQLTPEEALEVLRRLVEDCRAGHAVAPALMGYVRGMVERKGAAGESQTSASEQAYEAMREHNPQLGQSEED
jgi:hypothetical protein